MMMHRLAYICILVSTTVKTSRNLWVTVVGHEMIDKVKSLAKDKAYRQAAFNVDKNPAVLMSAR